MSSRRASRAVVLAVAMTLFLGACAPDQHSALEPLRGPDSEPAGVDPAADIDAGLAGEPVIEIPGDAPEGFGEVPLDELALPPDVAPPPVEGGPAPDPGSAPDPGPAPAAPTTAPATGGNPPASTPLPTGGSGGVASASDYCGLWNEYGSVMAAVDSAIYSGSGVSAAMGLAAQVHDRAAELDSGLAADHRRIASSMRALETLLGSYGYDIGRLMEAMETDAGVASRFEATLVDDSLDRTTDAVFNRCGVSLI